MKKYIILSLGLAAMLPALTACDDYLDKDPSKSSSKTITEASQLDALLATYSTFIPETDYTFISSDDYGLTPEIQLAKSGSTSIDDIDEFTWSTTNSRSGRLLWDGEFAKIFRANLVLANVDNVSGSEAEKANLKAEAHLDRAYSMFQLAVVYCQYPSAENAGDLGLPLKASTSFEESVARASLGETIGFIESDLQEALKITKPFTNSAGTPQNWRATTAAAKAFAARFYLYLGNYDKAAGYADEVLSEYSELKDLNDPNEMYYAPDDILYTINQGTPEEEVVHVKMPYIYNQRLMGTSGYPDLFGWKGMIFARTLNYASWWYLPSQSLLDCFARDVKDGNPDNDLRYRYFMIEDYGLRYCTKDNAGRTFGYAQFYLDQIISGLSVAEMRLIKAEAFARNGHAGDAINELNTIRRYRIATEAYEDLPVGTPAEALKRVLDERRREIPFSIRWYDIKRYAWNDDPSDDVTINRPFFPHNSSTILTGEPVQTYTLELKSRKYARPIPEVDILRSDGQLIQNTY